MEFLVALLPAAGCAVLMLVCFRMMRHPEMHGEPTNAEVVVLGEEVASLRDQLERTGSVPLTGTGEAAARGGGRPARY